MKQGEKTLYVAEKYCLKGYTEYTESRVSLDVPTRIVILGEENHEFFRVSLSGEKQRPSVEYLLEFGLHEL